MTNTEKVKRVFELWIQAWNEQNAGAMRDLLAADCRMVGFDGSQMNGGEEIYNALSKILGNNPTGLFVVIVRDIIELAPGVILLSAVAGMVPRGYTEVNPNINAVQSLIATEQAGPNGPEWRIRLFQNTPAAFHGQPQLAAQLTEELQKEFQKNKLT